jgi:hypothetical protein
VPRRLPRPLPRPLPRALAEWAALELGRACLGGWCGVRERRQARLEAGCCAAPPRAASAGPLTGLVAEPPGRRPPWAQRRGRPAGLHSRGPAACTASRHTLCGRQRAAQPDRLAAHAA